MSGVTIHLALGRHGEMDVARCEIGRVAYEARSTRGAIPALCRVLIAAGIPDQSWHTAPDAALSGDSIRKMAAITYSEADGTIQRRPWKAWISRDGFSPMRADDSGEGYSAL